MDAGFLPDVKVCIARRFFNEASARLYQTILGEEGVESFISNSITSTLIPFGEGGFILHVRESDLKLAREIMKEIDKKLEQYPAGDFTDADLEDIHYEKQVWEYDQRLKNSTPRSGILILIITLSILIIYTLLIKNT